MNLARTIEKYTWVVNLLLLFLVAYFLAGFVTFQFNKKYLLAQTASPRRTQPTLVSSGFSYHPPASKIIEGNIFGTIPQPPPGQEGAGAAAAVTNIEAELLGVIYFSWENPLNQATIKLKQENRSDVYKLEDEVSAGVKVWEIWPTRVVLQMANGATQELLFQFGAQLLPGMGEYPGGYVDPYAGMSKADKTKALMSYRKGLGIDDNIQQLSENYYKIKKDAIEKAMGNLNEIVTQARMVPNFVNDGANRKVDGFRIFKIVPGSIFEKLGIRDGDVIKSINNAGMDSVEKGFELMQSLRYEKKFEIDVLRGGSRPMTMNYQVVD